MAEGRPLPVTGPQRRSDDDGLLGGGRAYRDFLRRRCDADWLDDNRSSLGNKAPRVHGGRELTRHFQTLLERTPMIV